jgi:hypothetical protein
MKEFVDIRSVFSNFLEKLIKVCLVLFLFLAVQAKGEEEDNINCQFPLTCPLSTKDLYFNTGLKICSEGANFFSQNMVPNYLKQTRVVPFCDSMESYSRNDSLKSTNES